MRVDLSALPPWLGAETRALVRDKIDLLVSQHPDILAVILYGSIARHEERSLDESDPSDVDLLAVLDTNDPQLIVSRLRTLVATMGQAEERHLNAPREVDVMFSSRTSQEWAPEFIANVKRDGIVLYQRGELPAPFAA